MDIAYVYRDPTRLYLNVTNRCTSRCIFCVREERCGLGDGTLRGGAEPTLDDLLEAVEQRGGARAFEEIVWCGFGEPSFRLDLICAAAAHLRAEGCRIRLDTNGHACLINGRDVVPELAAALDTVSVSLNAPDGARYLEICRPAPASLPGARPVAPEQFWEATTGFIESAGSHFDVVAATVVGAVLSADEIAACETLARRLGAERFRVR